MAISKKQLKANRKNAKKGGVKTEEGKSIVKHNALKHGLLAKEVVITTGEGAESQEEFDALLNDLMDHFKPVATMEQMLVEKMTICHWRLKRAYRYEAGLIREKLDNATYEYYEEIGYEDVKLHRTDDEINAEIESHQEEIKEGQGGKKAIIKIRGKGKGKSKDLKEAYDMLLSWEWVDDKYSHLLEEAEDDELEGIKKVLNQEEWSDEKIWRAYINICDIHIESLNQEIKNLQKEKQRNELGIQVFKKLGGIPDKYKLDKLLKYEGSIEKQFYKAMNQLERLQRLRAGDNVPPPIKLDIDLTSQDAISD